VLSEGTRRGIPPARLADLLAGGPTRAFGLAPRKGALAPGADADLLLWDPELAWTIDDDSPFDGLEIVGGFMEVLVAGTLVS
jgi:dihydropyrimidinase